jgi:pimeloyl-ACP methyl ester carboxylesterase
MSPMRVGMQEGAAPTWAREAAQVPSESRRVMIDGVPIHYLTWGEPHRQPVVLVHGTAAHAEWWRFIAPLLMPDYFVVALDLSGMGDSGYRASYARQDFVDQVIGVARHAAPGRPPFVVGHSLGGFITILVGHCYGEELAGIIVVDSPIHAPGTEPERAWKRRAEIPNAIYAGKAEAISRFRLTPDQPCENGFYLSHIAEHSIKQVPGGWTWKFDPSAFSGLSRRSYVDELLGMRIPVALFRGQRSVLFPAEVRSYMGDTFGDRMPMVEIADARHHVLLDQPIALAAAIRTQLVNWERVAAKRGT